MDKCQWRPGVGETEAVEKPADKVKNPGREAWGKTDLGKRERQARTKGKRPLAKKLGCGKEYLVRSTPYVRSRTEEYQGAMPLLSHQRSPRTPCRHWLEAPIGRFQCRYKHSGLKQV